MSRKILIVDDEPDILEFLGYYLRKEGFEVLTAADGKSGYETAKKEMPDLILLDVMMPGQDGIAACREIRKVKALENTMIVFLTARHEDFVQVQGLESGADDYITKPVKPPVLISRIKAILRRKAREAETPVITAGELTIDRVKFEVRKNNEIIPLPRKEFQLLLLLASKAGKVFPRDEILQKVWGNDVVVGDRTIDVHVRKIREKIGENRIATVKGIGYRFEEDL